MTSPNAISQARSANPLGTLTVIPWTIGPTPQNNITAFLMVYSLGDGRDGPEAGEIAMRQALESMGLQVGGEIADGAQAALGVHLLVEAQRAVLSLPFMKVQCPVPAEWEAAAHQNGQVVLICATTPWPDARPGETVTEAKLKTFVADERVVRNAAHLLMPVRRIQG
ncbi:MULTISPECIES: DUF5949 family protein [Streptomyces]|uniref:DUF5949 family protein n=1 Tax=Streptomyces solicathayae TaxID=3081768 RepID=A0ABZ0LSC6_9ACTN|nr:DUF5949 family protein [Streptomyces sp. HUAS YS2]WOX22392.1 DUF5949 family protein [Streptomyces sp. HUAS YS2]